MKILFIGNSHTYMNDMEYCLRLLEKYGASALRITDEYKIVNRLLTFEPIG